jgi:hypothetical protein
VPWRPSRRGERPTLGWEVLDWFTDNLAAPDRAEYEPFAATQEQAEFVLRFYELDAKSGKRKIRRAVLSRPRGWGKSPFLAAIACAEALGPVVFDGWDSAGQPVGRPWATIRTPLVQVAAVSEMQTKNSWSPLLEMLRSGPVLDNYPGLEPLDTFVNLPRGRIETITSSAHTVKGNRAVFAVMDQTEEWTRSNGGHRLSEVMLDNATKLGGSTIETPNAFTPGMDSVAERTANAYQLMQSGRTRMADGLQYDHREAPATTDLANRESLLAGLSHAYGDSAECNGGWVDLDRVIARIWDPDMPPQLARADFLNQVTHASDSWLSKPEWNGVLDVTKVVADRDVIVLGFDGSRSRSAGIADATALIGCRVSDGHLFELGVWEQPLGPIGDGWSVPVIEVEAAVRAAFARYQVVGFYADPAKWESYIAQWEATYGKQLQVKSTRDHPIEWWMTGGRSALIVRALEQFYTGVLQNDLSHDGSSTLTRHILNARRRPTRSGITIAKDHPDSDRKIDAAVAAVLAYQARLDAVAAGVKTGGEDLYMARRIR